MCKISLLILVSAKKKPMGQTLTQYVRFGQNDFNTYIFGYSVKMYSPRGYICTSIKPNEGY